MKVTLEHLSKHFGNVVAVDNLDLDIVDGEFVALLGPSGCGKTTTLLMIAGIYKPTSGTIRFGDRVVNHLSPKDRRIGMVFQSYALYPHMTAYQNITFPLSIVKTPKEEMRERARRVAELVQIGELMDRRPEQLSGGQQQRVALARALVKEPDILLLDEPLSNLDAKLRLSMRAEIKRLVKDVGITSIYVTHDQVEAMTMADRVALLRDGHLQTFDTPNEMYDRPRNLFVAGFIGSPPMNFVPVSLEVSDGRYTLRNPDLAIEIPPEKGKLAQKRSSKAEMVLGIRPEDMVVRLDGEGVPAEVYVTEPLGRDLLVHMRAGKVELTALMPPSFRADMGDRVYLSANPEKLHLFDAETEKSLLLGD